VRLKAHKTTRKCAIFSQPVVRLTKSPGAILNSEAGPKGEGHDCLDTGGTPPWMVVVEQCTIAWMQEVERLRRQSRGAIAENNAGAVVEESVVTRTYNRFVLN